MDEPLERFLAAAGGDRWRVVCREVGATWSLPFDGAHQAA